MSLLKLSFQTCRQKLFVKSHPHFFFMSTMTIPLCHPGISILYSLLTPLKWCFFFPVVCFMFYWQTLFTSRMLSSYIFLMTLYPLWKLKIKMFQVVPLMLKPGKSLTFTVGHSRQQPQFQLLLLIYQIFYSVETNLLILLK